MAIFPKLMWLSCLESPKTLKKIAAEWRYSNSTDVSRRNEKEIKDFIEKGWLEIVVQDDKATYYKSKLSLFLDNEKISRDYVFLKDREIWESFWDKNRQKIFKIKRIQKLLIDKKNASELYFYTPLIITEQNMTLTAFNKEVGDKISVIDGFRFMLSTFGKFKEPKININLRGYWDAISNEEAEEILQLFNDSILDKTKASEKYKKQTKNWRVTLAKIIKPIL